VVEAASFLGFPFLRVASRTCCELSDGIATTPEASEIATCGGDRGAEPHAMRLIADYTIGLIVVLAHLVMMSRQDQRHRALR
jgi:hypothetical protein